MNDAFKDIEKLEADLWEAADNLRANSKLTSSDYFMPVLGVIFLRHAANRFEAASRQIQEDQTAGRMPKRKVLPADYVRRRALWLPENARYDWIMQKAATSGSDLPKLVTDAMSAIEDEFEPLKGVLPKDYGIFESKVLEDLMRLFNSEQIKHAAGDVFGRRRFRKPSRSWGHEQGSVDNEMEEGSAARPRLLPERIRYHAGRADARSFSGDLVIRRDELPQRVQGKRPGVVMGRKGTLGSVHFCDVDYWPHDTTLWSKDLRGNNPRFVYFFLHTINFKRFDVGNSNPTLNRNHIHDLPVLIPPADVQDRIADILSA